VYAGAVTGSLWWAVPRTEDREMAVPLLVLWQRRIGRLARIPTGADVGL